MTNCYIAAQNDQSQREDALASYEFWAAGYQGSFFVRFHHMYWNGRCIHCGGKEER